MINFQTITPGIPLDSSQNMKLPVQPSDAYLDSLKTFSPAVAKAVTVPNAETHGPFSRLADDLRHEVSDVQNKISVDTS